MPPKQHRQVPAKVTAYVDKDMKKLVEILNTIDKVWTFDSCQGDKTQPAHVYCGYGLAGMTSFLEMARFMNRIVKSFRRHMGHNLEGGYRTYISLEWWGHDTYPFISIEMPYDCIKAVTNIFSHVRSDLRNGI